MQDGCTMGSPSVRVKRDEIVSGRNALRPHPTFVSNIEFSPVYDIIEWWDMSGSRGKSS